MILLGGYWWLLIPGFLLALWAQWKVRSAFQKYSQVAASSGLTGAEVARELLSRAEAESPGAAAALNEVEVTQTPGELTDHYDPRDRVLRLSEPIYNSNSLAALGIAAHETGHALQHATGYGPLGLRSALLPAANFGSKLAFPLFFIGLILGAGADGGGFGLLLMDAGILFFMGAVVFTLMTLPVEFNASRRAIAMLKDGGYLSGPGEINGARAVLNAAALTYLAAAAMALLQLLYLVLLRNSRS